MQRGDILIQLGDKSIESVHDLMFALNAAKPQQTVTAVVLRDGKRVEMKVTYQERGARGRHNPHGQAAGAEHHKAGEHHEAGDHHKAGKHHEGAGKSHP